MAVKLNGFECLFYLPLNATKMKRKMYLRCVISYHIRMRMGEKKVQTKQNAFLRNCHFENKFMLCGLSPIKVDDISDTSETVISVLALSLIVVNLLTLVRASNRLEYLYIHTNF